jgi:hypothetical protein
MKRTLSKAVVVVAALILSVALAMEDVGGGDTDELSRRSAGRGLPH